MKINILALTLLLIQSSMYAYSKSEEISGANVTYKERLKEMSGYKILEKNIYGDVLVKSYLMESQSWSPKGKVSPVLWYHNVDIYIPKYPLKKNALVIVNSGIRYGENKNNERKKNDVRIDLSQEQILNISRKTRTAIVVISDVPNQALFFENANKPVIEDSIVAYSWDMFMKDDQNLINMPLQNPMALSISKGINLAKKELINYDIHNFIVAGASKRGWATWLAGIQDKNIVAIIPFVADLINTTKTMENIFKTYGGNWPIAFKPYYDVYVDKKIKSEEFRELAKLIDPYYILKNKKDNPREELTKYLINSGGDDFFVPDNSSYYYNEIKGPKTLRVVPNTSHFSIIDHAEDTVVSFLNRFQEGKPLPEVVEGSIKPDSVSFKFTEIPVKVIKWEASNSQARDFRFSCGIRYIPSEFNKENFDRVSLNLIDPDHGWKASFIEATFDDGFVATSQVYITPKDKYPTSKPPYSSSSILCQTLPGRGLK